MYLFIHPAAGNHNELTDREGPARACNHRIAACCTDHRQRRLKAGEDKRQNKNKLAKLRDHGSDICPNAPIATKGQSAAPVGRAYR